MYLCPTAYRRSLVSAFLLAVATMSFFGRRSNRGSSIGTVEGIREQEMEEQHQKSEIPVPTMARFRYQSDEIFATTAADNATSQPQLQKGDGRPAEIHPRWPLPQVKNLVPRDICPHEQFAAVLRGLLADEALLKDATSPVTFDLAYERYVDITKLDLIDEVQQKMWPVSTKRLVLDVSMGTTGTRWLTDRMKSRCFRTGHDHVGIGCLPSKKEKMNTSLDCTDIFDKADFIADYPVDVLAIPLLQSHPNAVVILTLRDPVNWLRARIVNHFGGGKHYAPSIYTNARNRKSVLQVSTFPGDQEKTGRAVKAKDRSAVVINPVAAIDVMVFYAWIACIVPPEKLLLINVFRTPDTTIDTQIDHFLKANGVAEKCPSKNWRPTSG